MARRTPEEIEREEREFEEAEARERAHWEELRVRIIAQADAQGDAGWMEINVPEAIRSNGKLRVPRGAFEQWAVARSGGGHLATPWRPIAPQGLKMGGDDRFHSDWMLGAGLNPQDMRFSSSYPHAEALRDAANDARFAIERRLLNFRCSVLLPGPYLRGTIFVPASRTDMPDEHGEHPPVVVLPNAGPDYLDVALTALDAAGGVIVERGGEMAHLVTVLRESHQGPIVRVPDARRKYPPGAIVTICSYTGTVALQDEMYSPFANNPDPFGDGSRYERTPEDDPIPDDPAQPLVAPDEATLDGAPDEE